MRVRVRVETLRVRVETLGLGLTLAVQKGSETLVGDIRRHPELRSCLCSSPTLNCHKP